MIRRVSDAEIKAMFKKEPLPTWTRADRDKATSEGWNLFDCEPIMMICRDDEAGKFEFDSDAVGHVRHRANEGCETAQKAIALMGYRSDEIPEEVIPSETP